MSDESLREVALGMLDRLASLLPYVALSNDAIEAECEAWLERIERAACMDSPTTMGS